MTNGGSTKFLLAALSMLAGMLCAGCSTETKNSPDQYYQGRLVVRLYYDREGMLHYVLGPTREERKAIKAGVAEIAAATRDVVIKSP